MKKIKIVVLPLLLVIINISMINTAYYSIGLNRHKKDVPYKSNPSQSLLEEYSTQEKNLIQSYEGLHEADKFKLSNLIQSKEYLATNTISNKLEQMASVPVTNYFNVQYYGNVYIGSTFQELSVIFDTGSNILWVSDDTCSTCRNFTNKYSPNNSTSFFNLSQKKNITYAIGYVNGTYVQDDVYINKISKGVFPEYSMGVNKFKFLLVNDERYLDGTISDGVLGLGIDFEGDMNNSFVYNLFQQNQIKKPYFTFYLTDSKKGSRLYIGDITENAFLTPLFNNMKYCSLNQKSLYWQCDIEKISLKSYNENNNAETIISENLSTSKVIFDTGTSYLLIPANDFLYMLPGFTSKALNHKCGVTPYLQFICQCKSPKDFDDIVLDLQHASSFGNSFKIKSENLIEYYPTLEFQCRFEILVDIFMMDAWILGDSVLRDSLISFDMTTREVSWVQDVQRLLDLIIDKNIYGNNAKLPTYQYIWYLLVGVFILAITFFVYRLAKYYARSESTNVNQDTNPYGAQLNR